LKQRFGRGGDEKKAVEDIMKAVMTKDFGSQYSREGQRNKKPFKELKLYDLIKRNFIY